MWPTSRAKCHPDPQQWQQQLPENKNQKKNIIIINVTERSRSCLVRPIQEAKKTESKTPPIFVLRRSPETSGFSNHHHILFVPIFDARRWCSPYALGRFYFRNQKPTTHVCSCSAIVPLLENVSLLISTFVPAVQNTLTTLTRLSTEKKKSPPKSPKVQILKLIHLFRFVNVHELNAIDKS